MAIDQPGTGKRHTSGWSDPIAERPLARTLLIGTALLFMALVLVVPLVAVFTEALRNGVGAARGAGRGAAGCA